MEYLSVLKYYTNIESSSVTNDDIPSFKVLLTLGQESKNTFFLNRVCVCARAFASIYSIFVEAFLYSSSQVKRMFEKIMNHYLNEIL